MSESKHLARAMAAAVPDDPLALPNAPPAQLFSNIMASIGDVVSRIPPDQHVALIADADWRDRGVDARVAVAVNAGGWKIVAWGEKPWDTPPAAGLELMKAW